MADFKRTIFGFLASRGISIGHCVPVASLRELLRTLHPIKTRLPLLRFGAASDGGYLIPDDLEGIVACFSPGVDVKASFEAAMVERNIPCYLADASVEAAPVSGPLIHFQKKYLGVVDDEMHLTLDKWVKANGNQTGDLLLQIDIEGWEWPVLLNVSDETLARFRIIAIELHALERLADREIFATVSATLGRLMQHFYVVHNHPNNIGSFTPIGDVELPSSVELTLIRKDRAEPEGYVTSFPHALDRTNVPGRPDPPLPKAWYRSEA